MEEHIKFELGALPVYFNMIFLCQSKDTKNLFKDKKLYKSEVKKSKKNYLYKKKLKVFLFLWIIHKKLKKTIKS